MLRSVLLVALISLIAGCTSHDHSLTVTSEPSGRPFSLICVDKSGAEVTPYNATQRMLTPYEIVVPQQTALAEVTVDFGDERQTKVVSLRHVHSSTEVWREPILGLAIGSKHIDTVKPRQVHFDLPAATD